MKDGAPAIDAHAYVDNCLTFEERKAFEARLRQDVDLRRQVELWQAQREAIRSTFGAPGRNPSRRPDELTRTFASVAPQSRGEPAELGNRQMATSQAGARARPKSSSRPRRAATLAALVLVGVILFPDTMVYSPRGALEGKGAAAFRAFSSSPASALDFRGVGADGLSDVLGPAFLAARLPEWVAPSGWRLHGAKRVPGLQGEAVLLLLDGAEGRSLGVLVEPLDAPASSAISTESRDGMTAAVFIRRGYGIAVMSEANMGVEAWLAASGFLEEGSPHPIR